MGVQWLSECSWWLFIDWVKSPVPCMRPARVLQAVTLRHLHKINYKASLIDRRCRFFCRRCASPSLPLLPPLRLHRQAPLVLWKNGHGSETEHRRIYAHCWTRHMEGAFYFWLCSPTWYQLVELWGKLVSCAWETDREHGCRLTGRSR